MNERACAVDVERKRKRSLRAILDTIASRIENRDPLQLVTSLVGPRVVGFKAYRRLALVMHESCKVTPRHALVLS